MHLKIQSISNQVADEKINLANLNSQNRWNAENAIQEPEHMDSMIKFTGSSHMPDETISNNINDEFSPSLDGITMELNKSQYQTNNDDESQLTLTCPATPAETRRWTPPVSSNLEKRGIYSWF